ncbi:protein phosphatase 1 regulatory subunit 12A-like isoform X3 [Artemia franciscana]|uniref:protein phosphatase 1 regulatory subunit 12A-like isoform X3 n=1 Tax=Artemia franciscana TaxID=6661 RepID=UPI0032D9F5E5
MSMENRANSSLFKRAEQLRRWEESETFKASPLPRTEPKKIKFSDGCVFLSACAANDIMEIDRLLANGADIDTANIDGLTALHQACIDDNLDMVEYLVRKGSDINKGDNEGWTPLHATASCGFLSIARFLIDHGADVAAVNNDGDLPVDIAESEEMTDLLQSEMDAQGIDSEVAKNMEEDRMVEDVNTWIQTRQISDRPHPKTGASALHVAAAKGYIRVLSLILRIGGNVNAQDYDGWTPLHAAVHWGQREACEMLCENFADMNIKNYAGQTVFDVADPDLLSLLDDLKKKQEEVMKKQIIKTDVLNNLITRSGQHPTLKRRSSVNRLSNHDRNQLIARDLTVEKKLGQERLEPNSPPETDIESPEGNDIEKRPSPGSESPGSNSSNSPTSEKSKVPGFVPSKPSEEDDGFPSWRRPGSVRTRPSSIGIILPNNSSPIGATSAPTTPSADKEDVTRTLSDSSNVTQSTSSLTSQETNDAMLRRTVSFDSDAKFQKKLAEIRERIRRGNMQDGVTNQLSPVKLMGGANLVLGSPSAINRSYSCRVSFQKSGEGVTKKENSTNPLSSNEKTLSPSERETPIPVTKSEVKNVNPEIRQTTSEKPPSVNIRSVAASNGQASFINGGQVPSNGVQNGKVGSMIKNFFKSFVPPVRDEESETQRKAHAKQVRATRRSTQGVTLEEIKTAENIMKQKQPITALVQPQLSSSNVPLNPASTASTTVPSASSVITSNAQPSEDNLERRPSWRLRVDDSKNKFVLEDLKGSSPSTVATVTPLRPPRGLSSPTIVPTVDLEPQLPPNVPIEAIAKRIKTVEDVNKDSDLKNGAGSQLAIQRRRRPKRRSTGVVQVGLEDIDPEKQNAQESGENEEPDDDEESLSDRSRASRPASTASSVAGDSVPASRPTTPSPSIAAPSSNEIDYKKLYEEEKAENERLRETVQELRSELSEAKAKLERSVQVSNARTALSEVEKRERRALERKLSEMEEELKVQDQLKADNQRLRDENGALIRVISKLSK